MNALTQYSPAQIALIKRTIANDLTPDEFEMFVELCKRNALDPFRGQASPIVFSAKSREKRRVALVVGIDGLRAIAERHDTYAPDEHPPEYEIDEALKSPTNPDGIVKCTVHVNKLRAGRWFRVPGVAFWTEFAPVTEEWAFDEAAGKKSAGSKWADMPRHMIAIAAERQALRKGWPDAFNDLYAPEEVAQTTFETAAEALAHEEANARAKRAGGRALTFLLDPQHPLEAWPPGEVADKLMAFIRDCPGSAKLDWFRRTNRESLKQFWIENEGDALEVKQAMEAREQALRDAELAEAAP